MDNNAKDTIRSAQNLIKAGAILCGISLIIGGVLLDIIALICILVGRSRFKSIYRELPENSSLEEQMNRMVKIALGVFAVATVLNGISGIMLWPIVQQAVQSGDLSSLYGLTGGSASSGLSGSSSTWG